MPSKTIPLPHHPLLGQTVEIHGNLPGQILATGRVVSVSRTERGGIVRATLDGNADRQWSISRAILIGDRS